MELHEHAETLQSRDDFIKFIQALADDLEKNPDQWENDTLSRFLYAMARWTEVSGAYYINKSEPVPTTSLTWKQVADLFMAARIYE